MSLIEGRLGQASVVAVLLWFCANSSSAEELGLRLISSKKVGVGQVGCLVAVDQNVVACVQQEVYLYDIAKQTAVAITASPDENRRYNGACPTPESQEFAVGEWGSIEIWDARKREKKKTIKAHDEPIYALALSPDSKTIASACHDHTVRLLNIGTWKLDRTIGAANSDNVSRCAVSLAFSNKGDLLAVGYADNTLVLWDLTKNRQRATVDGRRYLTQMVAFSHDDKLLLSAGLSEGRLVVHDVQTGHKLSSIRTHCGGVNALIMHHEDKFAIGGAGNWGVLERDRVGAVCVFDVREGKLLHKYSTGTFVTSICAMPDKKRIVTGEWDGTVKVWEYLK